jgi:hypothetical protein
MSEPVIDTEYASQLSDVPLVRVIESHEERDFDGMSKSDLIGLLPSNALFSWNKSKILLEVKFTHYDEHPALAKPEKRGILHSCL